MLKVCRVNESSHAGRVVFPPTKVLFPKFKFVSYLARILAYLMNFFAVRGNAYSCQRRWLAKKNLRRRRTVRRSNISSANSFTGAEFVLYECFLNHTATSAQPRRNEIVGGLRQNIVQIRRRHIPLMAPGLLICELRLRILLFVLLLLPN